jgi:hypothetical protein
MPKPTSRRARTWASGFEPGSIGAGMTPAQKKAYAQWLKGKAADGRAYERGLRGTGQKGRAVGADFAEV